MGENTVDNTRVWWRLAQGHRYEVPADVMLKEMLDHFVRRLIICPLLWVQEYDIKLIFQILQACSSTVPLSSRLCTPLYHKTPEDGGSNRT